MSTLQVRGLSEDLSRELKARAAAEGRSLSDYVLGLLEEIAGRPSRGEILRRLSTRRGADLPPAAEVLRDARRGR